MNNITLNCGAIIAGIALGIFFYGGLWWTVSKHIQSQNAALWFLLSLWIRMAVVAAGVYLVSSGHWYRACLCLVGFTVSRFVLTRLLGPRMEARHAA
jgi:F1F0 ATPase subunit 2